MPTTPPKTDPALERLAREAAVQIFRIRPVTREGTADIILKTLAPLSEVVEAGRTQKELASCGPSCEVCKAIEKLDAGREE